MARLLIDVVDAHERGLSTLDELQNDLQITLEDATEIALVAELEHLEAKVRERGRADVHGVSLEHMRWLVVAAWRGPRDRRTYWLDRATTDLITRWAVDLATASAAVDATPQLPWDHDLALAIPADTPALRELVDRWLTLTTDVTITAILRAHLATDVRARTLILLGAFRETHDPALISSLLEYIRTSPDPAQRLEAVIAALDLLVQPVEVSSKQTVERNHLIPPLLALACRDGAHHDDAARLYLDHADRELLDRPDRPRVWPNRGCSLGTVALSQHLAGGDPTRALSLLARMPSDATAGWHWSGDEAVARWVEIDRETDRFRRRDMLVFTLDHTANDGVIELGRVGDFIGLRHGSLPHLLARCWRDLSRDLHLLETPSSDVDDVAAYLTVQEDRLEPEGHFWDPSVLHLATEALRPPDTSARANIPPEVRRLRRIGLVQAERLTADWEWTTPRGEVLRSPAGDWKVWGDDGNLRGVTDEDFTRTHELVDRRYRRRGEVLARPVLENETITTKEGDVEARPGMWILTDTDGGSWPVDLLYLMENYTRVDSAARSTNHERGTS